MKFLRRPWVQSLLLLALGAVVVVLMLRQQDMGKVWAEMQKADLRYIALAVLLSGVGHVLRAARWRMMLRAAGADVRMQESFSALMIGYLVNFAVPRLGEITRCALLQRFRQVPILLSAGTVVAERVVDVLMLALLVAATFWTAGAALSAFLSDQVTEPLQGAVARQGLLLGVLAVVGVIALLGLYWLIRSGKLGRGLAGLRRFGFQMRDGLLAILRLDSKLAFGVQTLGIWISYWSGPVCTLLAMGMFRADGLAVSFAMFTMGSIARTIPVPAGSLGPYHWLVSQVLIAFAFAPEQAFAAATLNHATQTCFYFITGIGSIVWVALRKPDH